eukprot:TRINITY_DN1406_c1_g1_i2.p1 TRINITY_DN1406_c1_g1~~TRINITY_DN1406_c1_g1_i2.p1  ORF type:complete len:289 (-),score=95.01 TRINITY_DN1406_c1_g1_i2:25-891(-)
MKKEHQELLATAFLADLVKSVQSDDAAFVPRLDLEKVIVSYQNAHKRLLLLDYDGTLTPIVRDHMAASLPPSVSSSLKKLSSDPNNKIYVVSGRDGSVLDEWLEGIDVGICCEHGNFIREPKSEDWISTAPESIDVEAWRDSILTLMRYYEERTPGATVEEKYSSLAWHYRNADNEYSTSQAHELMAHLKSISNKYPVDVLWGNKVIEARPSGVTKGGAAKKIFQEMQPDFVLCIGDDKTDEDMFAVLDKSNPIINTIAVKRRPTLAKAYVKEQKEVISLLAKLAAAV